MPATGISLDLLESHDYRRLVGRAYHGRIFLAIVTVRRIAPDPLVIARSASDAGYVAPARQHTIEE